MLSPLGNLLALLALEALELTKVPRIPLDIVDVHFAAGWAVVIILSKEDGAGGCE